MPHAKNARAKTKPKAVAAHEEDPLIIMKSEAVPMKPSKAVDLIDEEEIASPIADERAEGAVAEDADSDEAAATEEEELDPTELNPFGDKWEE